LTDSNTKSAKIPIVSLTGGEGWHDRATFLSLVGFASGKSKNNSGNVLSTDEQGLAQMKTRQRESGFEGMNLEDSEVEILGDATSYCLVQTSVNWRKFISSNKT
jgi:hypothetical protein